MSAFEWVETDDLEHDSVCVRNSGEPDELAIFDTREETACGAWVTALEGSYVDLDDWR